MTRDEHQKLLEQVREDEYFKCSDASEIPITRDHLEDAILSVFWTLESLCWIVDELNGGAHDDYEQAIVNLTRAAVDQAKGRADKIVQALIAGLGQIEMIRQKYGEDLQWFSAQVKGE